jgi:hypothetical protein
MIGRGDILLNVCGFQNTSTLAINIPTYSSGEILGAAVGRAVRCGSLKSNIVLA